VTFARTKNLGKPGRWLVEAQKDAPSGGKAVGQQDNDDTNARYPLAVRPGVLWAKAIAIGRAARTA
jgi:hypothetical protein